MDFMQLGYSKILASIKYVYLIIFFALVSGLFYPVITHGTWDGVIIGTLILFLGLAGAVTLYKAGTADRHQKAYLIVGFSILAVATFLIYSAIGRI